MLSLLMGTLQVLSGRKYVCESVKTDNTGHMWLYYSFSEMKSRLNYFEVAFKEVTLAHTYASIACLYIG